MSHTGTTGPPDTIMCLGLLTQSHILQIILTPGHDVFESVIDFEARVGTKPHIAVLALGWTPGLSLGVRPPVVGSAHSADSLLGGDAVQVFHRTAHPKR